MTTKWNSLAKANADHYNEHPVTHLSILAVYLIAVLVSLKKLSMRMAKAQLESPPNPPRW